MSTIAGDDRPDRELVELDRDECLTLLAAEAVGRLAVHLDDDAPDVVPVNFALDGDRPVFRCHPGVVADHVVGARVALQVDRFDWFHRTGWSVLVKGVARVVAPADVALGTHVDTWVERDGALLVRIETDHVSGRRIELDLPALDERGYL